MTREPLTTKPAAEHLSLATAVALVAALQLLCGQSVNAQQAADASVRARAEEPCPAPGAATEQPTAASAPPACGARPADPASFLIEKIVVEGMKHGSAKIVAAETLLALGSSLTEPQLREALQRVQRLPFVVQADFSLRRGSERGRFELVIGVTEAKPVFFGGGLDFFRQGGCCGREGWISDGYGPGLGGRVFFGGQNELSAGLSGFGYSSYGGTWASFNLAYTHHNLFGRHVVGTVSFGSPGGGSMVGAQLALPLNRVNVLTLAADGGSRRTYPEWSVGPLSSPNTRLASRRIGLLWQRDTTDDPFMPRRGTRIGASITYTDSDYRMTTPWDLKAVTYPPPELKTTVTSREHALSTSFQASRYWPLSRRLSLGLNGRLGPFRADAEGAVDRDGLTQGIRPNDWGTDGTLGAQLLGTFPERRHGLTQFWWTLGATLADRGRWRDCDVSDDCETLPRVAELVYRDQVYGYPAHRGEWGNDLRSTHGTLSLSIAARGRWGTVALGFHYRYFFRDRPEWR